jgi:hypothetical protein
MNNLTTTPVRVNGNHGNDDGGADKNVAITKTYVPRKEIEQTEVAILIDS